MAAAEEVSDQVDVLEGGADDNGQDAELEKLQAQLYGEGDGDDASEDPESGTAQSGGDTVAAVPMTKSQMKKKARLERMLAKKADMRKREKEAKAAKRVQAAERRKVEQADMSEEQKAALAKERKTQREAKQAALAELDRQVKEKLKKSMEGAAPRIIIDLDWESYMNESEVRHLAQQLMFSYSANKHVEQPAHLMLTSFKDGVAATATKMISGLDKWYVTRTEQHYTELFNSPEDKARLVYLTADAEDELDELDERMIYVIGGLVDHNRHKGLCERQAHAAGIATARLPITRHVQLNSRAVLTVNHVYQILVEWYNCRDWPAVLDKVLPPRKRADMQREEQQQAHRDKQAQQAREQNRQKPHNQPAQGAGQAETSGIKQEGGQPAQGGSSGVKMEVKEDVAVKAEDAADGQPAVDAVAGSTAAGVKSEPGSSGDAELAAEGPGGGTGAAEASGRGLKRKAEDEAGPPA